MTPDPDPDPSQNVMDPEHWDEIRTMCRNGAETVVAVPDTHELRVQLGSRVGVQQGQLTRLHFTCITHSVPRSVWIPNSALIWLT
jgi:hypothetical protein